MIWHTDDIGVAVNPWKPHYVAPACNKLLERWERVQSLQKAVRQFLKQLNIKLPYIQPASPLPGRWEQACAHRHTCSCSLLRCSQQTNTGSTRHDHALVSDRHRAIHPYTGFHSAINGGELLTHDATSRTSKAWCSGEEASHKRPHPARFPHTKCPEKANRWRQRQVRGFLGGWGGNGG